MSEAYIKTEIKDSIAFVNFFSIKGNSFTLSQLNEFAQTFNDLDKNEAIRIIILKSDNPHIFCAGASFKELVALDNEQDAKTFFMGFANVLMAMTSCSKFIIGVVSGKVVGGGTGIVAACDWVISTKKSVVKLSELSIGIGPFVIEPAITHKIGMNAFGSMTFNPDQWKSATWAREKGLFSAIVDDPEYLIPETLNYAEKLLKYSPLAMKNLKSIMWETSKNWKTIMPERAEMSAKLVLSPETKSILNNFLNK